MLARNLTLLPCFLWLLFSFCHTQLKEYKEICSVIIFLNFFPGLEPCSALMQMSSGKQCLITYLSTVLIMHRRKRQNQGCKCKLRSVISQCYKIDVLRSKVSRGRFSKLSRKAGYEEYVSFHCVPQH